MIGISLFLLLISDSLTISPIGLTWHGSETKHISQYAPRKLDSDAAWTWHPELNILYKQKYMQYSLFFMKDTVDQPAGGLLIGPKFDFNEFFSIGAVGGAFIRKSRFYTVPNWTIGGAQVIPMAGITASVTVPITKNVGIETNILGNWFVNHATTGIKIQW